MTMPVFFIGSDFGSCQYQHSCNDLNNAYDHHKRLRTEWQRTSNRRRDISYKNLAKFMREVEGMNNGEVAAILDFDFLFTAAAYAEK